MVWSTERLPIIHGMHQWLIRNWNEHHESKIVDLKIYFLLEDYLHPDDGQQKVTIYPIERIDSGHKAVFAGDIRRNQEMEGAEPFSNIE